MTVHFLFVAASILVTLNVPAFSFPSLARNSYRGVPSKHNVPHKAKLNPLRFGASTEDDAILLSEAESLGNIEVPPIEPSRNTQQTELLKRELYQLAASYDRGFSATPRARQEASRIIQKLAAINPTTDASWGIDGGADVRADVPLKAIWRMIWTSALDVVSLGASPLAGEFLFFLRSFALVFLRHNAYFGK